MFALFAMDNFEDHVTSHTQWTALQEQNPVLKESKYFIIENKYVCSLQKSDTTSILQCCLLYKPLCKDNPDKGSALLVKWAETREISVELSPKHSKTILLISFLRIQALFHLPYMACLPSQGKTECGEINAYKCFIPEVSSNTLSHSPLCRPNPPK